jgi:hypothetical protein
VADGIAPKVNTGLDFRDGFSHGSRRKAPAKYIIQETPDTRIRLKIQRTVAPMAGSCTHVMVLGTEEKRNILPNHVFYVTKYTLKRRLNFSIEFGSSRTFGLRLGRDTFPQKIPFLGSFRSSTASPAQESN